MKRTARQLYLFLPDIPVNIVIIKTDDADLNTVEGCEVVIRRMLQVPLDKSMLLDFLIGRRRGDPHDSENHADLHRIQALLNSRFRSKRFDWMGDGLVPTMARAAVAYAPTFIAELRARKSEGDLELPIISND